MDVGFIGLGRMGAGMAANLLKAGHRVTVYNRTHHPPQAKAAPTLRPRGTTLPDQAIFAFWVARKDEDWNGGTAATICVWLRCRLAPAAPTY